MRDLYREKLGRIKTDPLDLDSLIDFNKIYTNLFLLKEGTKRAAGKPSHDDVFEFFTGDQSRAKSRKMAKQRLSNEEFRDLIAMGKAPFRLLIVGEAGVGKTTFLAKIVNDWISEEDCQDTDILLHIPLREAEDEECFGNVLQKYMSENLGSWLDEYIEANQRDSMVLLDGLDEFDGDITKANPHNAFVKIMRGEKYENSIVILTTRPWTADQILRNENLKRKFTCVSIGGFDEENAREYVLKFFADNQPYASSLIQFLKDDKVEGGVFSSTMASYPIYLAMLCHLWRDESRRSILMKLQTVSQLIDHMVQTLKEHFASKESGEDDDDEFVDQCICLVNQSLENVGEVAYQGVLTKQLVICPDAPNICKESLEIVRRVGVLTREKIVVPMHIRHKTGVRFKWEYRVPHALLQDYLGAVYLSALFHKDEAEFRRRLKEDLLSQSRNNIDRFEYLWYFIAAQDPQVAKATLDILTREVDNVDFIIRLAFECHNKDVIAPFTKVLLENKTLRIDEKRSLAAHLYVLDTSQAVVGHGCLCLNRHYGKMVLNIVS